MLHTLFTSFYVDYFVRGKLQHISAAPTTASDVLAVFSFGQLAYALWNGLNDLGFGWLGDTSFSILQRRRFNRISFGGPLWAVVFAILWLPLFDIPLLHPAVQFSVMMIVYDGFFSFTTVAFRALLTDIATNPREREACNAAAAVFHVVGSLGVGIASFLYEGDTSTASRWKTGELDGFRTFTTVWAVCAAVGFLVASHGGKEVVLRGSSKSSDAVSLCSFSREALQRPSMIVAVVVWAFQEYSCTFATNFFGMFLALVCGDVLSRGTRSSLLLLSFVAPHCVTLAVTPLIPSVGKKRIVSALFWVRCLVGITTLFVASIMRSASEGLVACKLLFAVLLFLNRVLTEGVCRLQSLVLSDISDEDIVLHDRPQSHAATVNGLVSLISKPFQSLAPVVTCYFLAAHGVILNENSEVDESGKGSVAPVAFLLGLTAVLTSSVMGATWQSYYPLEGAYLHNIQVSMKRRGESRTEHADVI